MKTTVTNAYATLEVQCGAHPKLGAKLTIEEFGLWSHGKVHCALHLTDGFIPDAAVRGFGACGRGPKIAHKLVAKGVWSRDDERGGYVHLGYLDHNPSKADVLAARAAKSEQASAAGKASAASRQRLPNGRLAGAGQRPVGDALPTDRNELPTSSLHFTALHGSNQGGRSEPARLAPGASAEPPTPSDVDPEVRRITREQQYAEAYEAGIAAGKGGPYAMPTNQAGDLHRAILKFSEGRRDERLLNWIREAAADFAHDITRRAVTDPKIIDVHAAYAPRGFVRWLSTEERNAEAKAVGS